MKILDYKLYIFDLDDTLYNELDYLIIAYNFVSKQVCKKNINLSHEQISSYLESEFKIYGRTNLYQKLIKKFNISNFSIKEFLHCLRTVKIKPNSIIMIKQVNKLIRNLIENKKKIVILTNGNHQQQQNKFNSINIPFKNKILPYYASSKGKEFQKPNNYFVDIITLPSKIF